MRSTLLWAVLLSLCYTTSPLVAQRTCGSSQHLQKQLNANPSFQQNLDELESYTDDYTPETNRILPVGTIPVVFHIIHSGVAEGTAENISKELICAQIDQLNEDYNTTNSDIGMVPAEFQSEIGNADITFCLASVDPFGNPTDGIVRWNFGATQIQDTDFDAQIKPCTIWDRDSYLNIWTAGDVLADFGPPAGIQPILGYAQFPGGPADTDGVVCAVGTIGSLDCPNPAGGVYDNGRTATHEVGHWLNLRHIWGDDGGACTGSDLVGDTPNQGDSYGGCPVAPQSSCGSNDMFMNYMDYVNDDCMHMFSAGQATRMQAALTGSRGTLLTSAGCNNTEACPPNIQFTVVDESGVGKNDGAIIIDMASSEGCLEYSINNGAFGENNCFSGLGCGSYPVSVRDGKEEGCMSSMMITIDTRIEEPTTGASPTATCTPPTLTVNCPACESTCPFDPSSMNISVSVQGTHSQAGTLGFYLTSPSGSTATMVTTVTGCVGGFTDYNLTFTNGTGSNFNHIELPNGLLTGTFNEQYSTAIAFKEFTNDNIYGDWTLSLLDCFEANGTGVLQSYSLTISGGCLTAPVTMSATPNSNVPDAGGGLCGQLDETITFVAPAAPTVTVEWYDAMTNGTQVGTGTTFTPSTTISMGNSGSETYYAQCVCAGCDSKRTPVSYSFDCPLPVELVSFEGKAVASTTVLDWTTASELDNSHFEVEHSLDGEKFVTLGKVTGAGTTIEPQAYNFVDVSPKIGINYYRLKQVDFAGTFEYSDVVAIEFGNKVVTEVFPSPASDFLTVKTGKEIRQIQVIDVTGKVVLSNNNASTNLLQLNVSNLLAGTYFVSIEMLDGDKDILRFVKN